jgi:hypothetical protein
MSTASIKVGSQVQIPVPSFSSGHVSDSTVIGWTIANGILTLKALKVGQCTVFLVLGSDFQCELIVNVVA